MVIIATRLNEHFSYSQPSFLSEINIKIGLNRGRTVYGHRFQCNEMIAYSFVVLTEQMVIIRQDRVNKPPDLNCHQYHQHPHPHRKTPESPVSLAVFEMVRGSPLS